MLVREFLRWIDTAPTPRRVEAVGALVRAFAREQEPRQKEALEAALTVLLDDSAPEVRQALAATLALDEKAPRHLVLHLAGDQPLVAEPILARSAVLLDSELVDFVAAGVPRLQRAIARRPRVSRAVSAAIAEVGTRGALVALASNPNARIAAASFARMAERHGAEPRVRDALFARPDLPMFVRQDLIARLSDALGNLVMLRAWLPDDRARAMTREACDKATIGLLAAAAPEDVPALVAHLRASGQLTTTLLIRAVCGGHLAFLEAALASLSGLPERRIYPLLAEGNESSLRALFGRCRLPVRSHGAFLAAILAWRDLGRSGAPENPVRYARAMVERTLVRYQAHGADGIDDLRAMLRRFAADAARDAALSYVAEGGDEPAAAA